MADSMNRKIANIINSLDIVNEMVDENSTVNLADIGLNSFGFVKLVVELEKQFDNQIEDDDLILANFNSIQKIADYIDKYNNSTCQ